MLPLSKSIVELSTNELRRYSETARDLALLGGSETLKYFRGPLDVETKPGKGKFDPVTAGDRAAERAIRDAIADRFPEHGVLGEEFGLTAGNGLTWVIDPIDGTRAFMSGLLHWGVLVGLFDGQRAVAGALCQPVTGEVFWGDGSQAWYRRGERGAVQELSVRRAPALEEAIGATSWVGYFEHEQRRDGFTQLVNRLRLMHRQGDCYLYGLLAMGQLDLVLDGGLQPYDILPLIPIIEGAGGVVLGAYGQPAHEGGFVIAAASRAMADTVRDLLVSDAASP
ncbi:MAG: inositol monophosphatase family protein [Pseudomonadota bacterium]